MTQETRTKILMLRAKREPHKVICNETGVSPRTVLRVLAENRTQFVMHQADSTDKSFYKFGMEPEIQTEFLAMDLAKAEESLAKRNYDSIPTDKLHRIVDKLRADARKLFEKKEKDLEKCLEREDQIDERRRKEQDEAEKAQAQEEEQKRQEYRNAEQDWNEIPSAHGYQYNPDINEHHLTRHKANPISETPEPEANSVINDGEAAPTSQSTPSTSSDALQEPAPTNTAQIIPLPSQDTGLLDQPSTSKPLSETSPEPEDQQRAGCFYRSAASHQNAQNQPQNRRMA